MPGAVRSLARREAEARENGAGLDRHARIDQHGGQRRQADQRPERFAGAPHHARAAGKADGNVGARRAGGVEKRGSSGARLIGVGEQPQRRRGVRRAAADAGRDRQPLFETEGAEAQILDPLGEIARGAQHEIVVAGAGRGRGRAGDIEREGRRGRQATACRPRR